jgi:uncharacterized protein
MSSISANRRPGPQLFGQTRSALLSVFFGHTADSFYLRQLARLVGGGHGALQRELKMLVAIGLITRNRSGNQVLYRANPKSPIFGEMKRLVAKTLGVHDSLRSALAPLAAQVQVAFVYGSLARHAEHATSDIDLMIVGEASFSEVVSALSAAQRSLGREINPMVFSPAEFKAKLNAGNHFLRSVMREKKLLVVGTEHELAKLASKRLAG